MIDYGSLTEESVRQVLDETKRELDKRLNEKLANNLDERLSTLKVPIRSKVEYKIETMNIGNRNVYHETSNVIVYIGEEREVSIFIECINDGELRRTPLNIQIDTSFGNANNLTDGNTLASLPFSDWTTYDTAGLLDFVIDTTILKTSKDKFQFVNVRNWAKPPKKRWSISKQEERTRMFQIFKQLTPIVSKYGFNDIEVVQYSLRDDSEICNLELYHKDGEIIETYVYVDLDYHIFTVFEDDIIQSLSEVVEISDEDYYKIIKACLPINGDRVVREAMRLK